MWFRRSAKNLEWLTQLGMVDAAVGKPAHIKYVMASVIVSVNNTVQLYLRMITSKVAVWY